MKKRPVLLKLIALVAFLVPIFCYFILHHIDPHFFGHLPVGLRLVFVVFMVGSWVAAAGIWMVKPWGFNLFVLYGVLILLADASQIIIHPRLFNFWHGVDIVLSGVGLALIFRKSLRRFFFDRALRWWERATRVDVAIDGNWHLTGDRQSPVHIVNMSQSGCLLKVDGAALQLGVNEEGQIVFALFGKPFRFKGKVARYIAEQSLYGIHFEDTHLKDRWSLGMGLRKLRRQITPANRAG